VGGGDIALTILLKPGAEAHEFEMAPTTAAAIEKSDVILESGAGLEAWLDAALENVRAASSAARPDLAEGFTAREWRCASGPPGSVPR
jgi:zinc/manganese transport system substrate-binding protein/manganese/iron transport system substrate-binding protein